MFDVFSMTRKNCKRVQKHERKHQRHGPNHKKKYNGNQTKHTKQPTNAWPKTLIKKKRQRNENKRNETKNQETNRKETKRAEKKNNKIMNFKKKTKKIQQKPKKTNSKAMALMLGGTAVTPATERRTSSGGDSEAKGESGPSGTVGLAWVWVCFRLFFKSLFFHRVFSPFFHVVF